MKNVVVHRPARRLEALGTQTGFTLVELMVGVLLGMITVLLIAQIYAQSEGNKRASSSGADAQVNGTLSLFTIARDVEMGGYGISVRKEALGCPVKAQYGTSALKAGFVLAPVVITEKGSPDGVSDSLVVLRADTPTFSVPMRLISDHPIDKDFFVVQSTVGVREGDFVVAVPPVYDAATAWCTAIQVHGSGSNALTATNLPHVSDASAPWNQNALANFPAAGYKAGSSGSNSAYLVNLGRLIYRRYQVTETHSLQSDDTTVSDGAGTQRELFPEIVRIRALYGKDTDGDGRVDRYDATTPMTADEWQKVLTVRIAVVARGAQWSKDEITTTAPSWDLGSTTDVNTSVGDICTAGTACKLSLSVSHLDDWKHYSYRVFETIVPLRNVLWNS